MHSLKPSGDNIASEFFRLIEQKGLAKTASEDSSEEQDSDAMALSEQLDSTFEANKGQSDASVLETWAEHLQEAIGKEEATLTALAEDDELGSGSFDDFSDDDLESMIIDESDDPLSAGVTDVDQAHDDLVAASDALDSELFQTASEKRVLVGLSKIATSLREKGEGFAADVVESTALSIKGDLNKESSRRALVILGLEKLAGEFYSNQDFLEGDMVQVTINKITGLKQK